MFDCFSRVTFIATILIPVVFLTAGCSVTRITVGESCNSRAFVSTPLDTYLKERFQGDGKARVALMPFVAPANLAASRPDVAGFGRELANRLHYSLLATGSFPIVEIFNRDWPGLRDEFFTGNHSAINVARDAGYDFVLVGMVEPPRSLDMLGVYAKLIDTASSLTIWYGQVVASSNRRDNPPPPLPWMPRENVPSRLPTNLLLDEVARCLAHEIATEGEKVPRNVAPDSEPYVADSVVMKPTL